MMKVSPAFGVLCGMVFVAWCSRSVRASSLESNLKGQFYTRLDDASPCLRLNRAKEYAQYSSDGTSDPVGCTTPTSGVHGLLFPIESQKDVDAFRKADSYDRVAVLTPEMMTGQVLWELSKASHFVGAVMLSFPPVKDYSPASTTAFEYVSTHWNPLGRDLLNTKYGFPIVALDGEEARSVYNKARKNKKNGEDSFPQDAMMMYYDMGPVISSDECMRKRWCEAIGGQSVWGSTGNFFTNSTQYDTILVMTQLDAPSLFHDQTFGADTTLSSLIATLAAMDALGNTDVESLPIRILPMAFQGEFYGRLGSQMLFDDIFNFECKDERHGKNPPLTNFCRRPLQADLQYKQINLTRVKAALVPDQVGQISSTKDLYAHTQGDTNFYYQILEKVVDDNDMQLNAASSASLPPSPADSLLKYEDNANVILLSPYNMNYTNKFYGSRFDNGSNISPENITEIANVLAQSLYAMATGKTDAQDAVNSIPAGLKCNATLVKELIHCTTTSSDCELFRRFLPDSNLLDEPLTLYPGTYMSPTYSSAQNQIQLRTAVIEAFTRNFLAFSLSNSTIISCKKDEDCEELTTSGRCVAGACVEDFSHYHDAYSLAFRSAGGFIRQLDWTKINRMDPGFTEPVWSSDIGARLFVSYGFLSEIMPLLVGVGLTALTIASVRFLQNYLTKHFKIA